MPFEGEVGVPFGVDDLRGDEGVEGCLCVARFGSVFEKLREEETAPVLHGVHEVGVRQDVGKFQRKRRLRGVRCRVVRHHREGKRVVKHGRALDARGRGEV